MANKKDEEQRKQQEYRELLKLKQGLIDESELIPETGYEGKVELHGFKKIENFLYHNKVIIIVLLIAAAFLSYMIYQTVTRKKNDIYVLVINTAGDYGLYSRLDELEEALEKYCPDFDNNGYVHVGINYIDLYTGGGMSDYSDAQGMKFQSELLTGDSQMYIADTALIDYLTERIGVDLSMFADFTEQYPDAVFGDGYGLQLNTTDLMEDIRWTECPDELGIYVRDVFENMTGNDKDAQEQRERAKIVLDNIINGNIVNPTDESGAD